MMERSRAPGAPLPPYEPLSEGLDMEGLPRSTVVMVEPSPVPPPRDHFAWSLCTMLYGNICCLGFMALIFSVKSRDRKVLRDYSGALSYGTTSKYLNITALLLNIFFVILIIALLASGTIVVANLVNQEQRLFDGPT
ncbi:dispanin subfamily A member 2b-like [Indicator indicator]|uniref:dispanin subfamily A member 2b-like n=1 Tax=Indicator indicator TaxID=1002788 RepID=UPI0023DE7269|nr:dispanin subfamily A member 2b-like [Indicator indicator]